MILLLSFLVGNELTDFLRVLLDDAEMEQVQRTNREAQEKIFREDFQTPEWRL